MKKVFLSLAVIATLTVVSCKQADANAEATTDSVATEVEAAPVVDSAATTVDSAATEAAATEAAPAEAAH
ncbi:PG1828 family lipoprotein [Flavobacterium capsici]|uniref:Lipoprotein n=1 Tax=Flavobacterium capsici TaxID=3075618 RepID=A0AA96F0F4_9FLAO|nr:MULTISPECIES: hypothetical protein [unclassified Flavobacterium]WNM19244.1 hypothetical protein RN608_00845 [Flavobacterium sp. PMR2A8]WNM20633.1 hypothetical protein RN605_08015 [Flavobacterium sp. PMTSA4]